MQADIFLAPTPITLGLRTRLIEAMSLGSCIVAHQANQPGMPEMRDTLNAMLGVTGEGIARLIDQCAGDPAMRYRLGHNARNTYEECFSPEKAGGIMADMIEGVVKAKIKIAEG